MNQVQTLLVPEEQATMLKQEALTLPEWIVTERQICDLELLLNGGFAPLTGFLNQADYQNVLDNTRLENNQIWPIPITLDVTEEFANSLNSSQRIALRDAEGVLLAIMTVGDIWQPDFTEESVKVYGTNDDKHPAVAYLKNHSNPYYVGGSLEGVQLPVHYDYPELRHTPEQLRDLMKQNSFDKVVAFQTRNPMHRAHVEISQRAALENNAALLIHPVVGMTKPGDVDHYARVRCYQEVIDKFENDTLLSLLPLAMRMGGPREALLHAIIRKNYGCTHMIVGRDHAGPGTDSKGEDFYGPYEAQEIVEQHQAELGIEMVPFQMMVYLKNKAIYMPIDQVSDDDEVLNISGTKFRDMLQQAEDIPEWFSYPEVVQELRKTYPKKTQQGFVLFMTGLSGSGKSTVANSLQTMLLALGENRAITLLDGDLVRRHLSSELGFSREHRDLNITRIGYVASEISKAGGIALCAPIAPYATTRRTVRELVNKQGCAFYEIHVATPLETCEARDRKGLYAKARAGIIKGFTGIDDPYEAPENAEIVVDTTDIQPDQAAQRIIDRLRQDGFLD